MTQKFILLSVLGVLSTQEMVSTSLSSFNIVGSTPFIQTEENIELSFDEEGMLNIKTTVSPIFLVRLFNHDGKKISVKPDTETKLLVLKDKLPSGSSWYVQIKTTDGKSNLRKITKP